MSSASSAVLPAGKRPEYVIEHMEEDDPDAPAVFPHWALLEYRHMLELVGPGSTVHFTSLSHASLESLRQSLSTPSNKPQAQFELHTASITTMMSQRGIGLDRSACSTQEPFCCFHHRCRQAHERHQARAGRRTLPAVSLRRHSGRRSAARPNQLAAPTRISLSPSRRCPDDHRHRTGCDKTLRRRRIPPRSRRHHTARAAMGRCTQGLRQARMGQPSRTSLWPRRKRKYTRPYLDSAVKYSLTFRRLRGRFGTGGNAVPIHGRRRATRAGRRQQAAAHAARHAPAHPERPQPQL